MSKFKVGDTVNGNTTGQLVLVTDGKTYRESNFCGVVIRQAEGCNNVGHYSSVWDINSFTLHPLDPPRIVLTDWQRKQLMKCSWLTKKFMMDDIESILSSPEPPKFVPKQGEAVLVRQNTSVTWNPRVFSKMFEDRYQCYALISTDPCNWNLCIPFDPALVGTVTND